MGFWQDLVGSIRYGSLYYSTAKEVLHEGISKNILSLDKYLSDYSSFDEREIYHLLFVSLPDRLERFKSVELKLVVDSKQVTYLENKLMDSYQQYLSILSCFKTEWN